MRFITRQENRGEIPGKPIFIGTQKEDKTHIYLIAYDAENFH